MFKNIISMAMALILINITSVSAGEYFWARALTPNESMLLDGDLNITTYRFGSADPKEINLLISKLVTTDPLEVRSLPELENRIRKDLNDPDFEILENRVIRLNNKIESAWSSSRNGKRVRVYFKLDNGPATDCDLSIIGEEASCFLTDGYSPERFRLFRKSLNTRGIRLDVYRIVIEDVLHPLESVSYNTLGL